MAAKGQINDSTWMKNRYARLKKNIPQLFFILTSTIFTNLSLQSSSNPPPSFLSPRLAYYHQFIRIDIDPEQQSKIKSIDLKFRNIDKRKAIMSLQDPRTIGTLMNQAYRLGWSDYIGQFRKCLLEQRKARVGGWLSYMTKQLNQKVAIVVDDIIGKELF